MEYLCYLLKPWELFKFIILGFFRTDKIKIMDYEPDKCIRCKQYLIVNVTYNK